MKIVKTMLALVKLINDDDGIFEAFASTENVDRDGEIIRADAFTESLKTHRKNGTHPKMLAGHSHWLPSGEPPVVGWSLSEEVVPNKGLKVQFKFAPAEAYPPNTTPLGPIYDRFYRLRLMDSLSVGFLSEEIKAEEDKPLEFTKVDLMEYSPVAVPSNRESLVAMAAGDGPNAELAKLAVKHLVARDAVPAAYTKSVATLPDTVKEVWTVESLKALVDECNDELKAFLGLEKNVVPFKSFPKADEDMSWSFTAAEGSAVLGEDNWSRFKSVHTFFDPAADEDNPGTPQVRGAYKLPHHKIVDDGIKTVFRGVVAAMGALLGARGGVDIPDDERPGVYNHLARHYREFDREPPEFRAYNGDEWTKFHADQEIDVKDGDGEGDPPADPPVADDDGKGTCDCAGRSLVVSIDMEKVARIERAAQIIEAKGEQVTGLLERLDALAARVEGLAQKYERLIEAGVSPAPAPTPDPAADRASELDQAGLDRLLNTVNETKQAAGVDSSRNGS